MVGTDDKSKNVRINWPLLYIEIYSYVIGGAQGWFFSIACTLTLRSIVRPHSVYQSGSSVFMNFAPFIYKYIHQNLFVHPDILENKKEMKLTRTWVLAFSTPSMDPVIDTWLLFISEKERLLSGKWMWQPVLCLTRVIVCPPSPIIWEWWV